MTGFIARRLLWALFIVWSVTTTAFFVSNVLPSDPARMVAGPQARPRDVVRIRQQLGLDKPVLTQYGIFMRRLVHVGPPASSVENQDVDPAHTTCAAVGRVHFDLGRSFTQRRPVLTVLGERLPRTLFLAACAVLAALAFGVTTGVAAALRRTTLLGHAAEGVALLGISAPTYVIGLGLQFVLAHKLRLLPLDGYGRDAGEHAVSVILPALTLGVFGAAYYTRLVREEMIGILAEDYVRTARAKGLGAAAVVVKHALRNALVPLVTILGLDLGTLVGGAIVTESVFRWPGIGALSVGALLDRDGPLIIGTVIVTSTAVVLCNLAVDLCYAALDPRVRK